MIWIWKWYKKYSSVYDVLTLLRKGIEPYLIFVDKYVGG